MNFSKTIEPRIPKPDPETKKNNFEQHPSVDRGNLLEKVVKVCERLNKQHRVQSLTTMSSAGFQYTNNGDTVRCHTCELEVSESTLDMEPFAIHSQRSPTCPFVISKLLSKKPTASSIVNHIETTLNSSNEEQLLKRLKIDATSISSLSPKFVEVDILNQVRKRTFSHWSHRSSPSSSQMIEAGFFSCNVGDRVICIYCNIICQQWTPNSDDPCEIHKTLSPTCPYVIGILIRPQTSNSTNIDPFRSNAIVYTAACNTAYIEVSKRYASFTTWPNDNLPSVDDLVRAGFFYTGTKTIVTCFYCNGSLQNWDANDNPTIEHARWFPNCAYIKQLCGNELYRKTPESKKAEQERARANNSNNQVERNIGNLNQHQLFIPDESTLSRLVTARLDLHISQSLLDRQFKQSIIKRCWEDQLRLKQEDFVSDCDLLVACIILQKQIECINGRKENIIVPNVTMAKQREREETNNSSRRRICTGMYANGMIELHAYEQSTSRSSSTNSFSNNDVETTTINETNILSLTTTIENHKNPKSCSTEVSVQNCTYHMSMSNLCILCLAIIPCDHSHQQYSL